MSNIGVNRVFLIGNAGQDAEVKSTSTGKNVANFSLAINEGFRDKAGKSGQRVEWVRCVAWNKLAEIAGKYVNKGRLVFVEGRLQTRQYENREGTEKTVCEVVVTTLRVLGGVKNDGPAHSDVAASTEAAPEAEVGDIPF
ncbi:MAG TPA: single-stranded DNA-binding protein [Candidatus Acidoferrales bacterium]|nr:single-stranded DNA-binding protein [Candidatus Acidoferrales bacterium]